MGFLTDFPTVNDALPLFLTLFSMDMQDTKYTRVFLKVHILNKEQILLAFLSNNGD